MSSKKLNITSQLRKLDQEIYYKWCTSQYTHQTIQCLRRPILLIITVGIIDFTAVKIHKHSKGLPAASSQQSDMGRHLGLLADGWVAGRVGEKNTLKRLKNTLKR